MPVTYRWVTEAQGVVGVTLTCQMTVVPWLLKVNKRKVTNGPNPIVKVSRVSYKLTRGWLNRLR